MEGVARKRGEQTVSGRRMPPTDHLQGVSASPDDMGPTNSYWPYYRSRPFIFQGHIASLGKASAGRGGKVAKAGAAQRGTSVIPQTKRGPTARGSCLPIQPGVNNATLFPPCPPAYYLSSERALRIAAGPRSQPGPWALGTQQEGYGREGAGSHHPPNQLQLQAGELSWGEERVVSPSVRAQP